MSSAIDELLLECRRFLAGIGDERLRGFSRDIEWSMKPRVLAPKALPCLAMLGRSVQHASSAARPLVRLLELHGRSMHWGQTYTKADFGERFIVNYGWLELFGTRGHFRNERVAAGFLLLGPDTVYPDHHHVAEGIYIPLSGIALWRKGDSGFEMRALGEVIHHPSNINHAMRTGEAPLLAFYLWRGGPLAQRSTIVGQTTAGGA